MTGLRCVRPHRYDEELCSLELTENPKLKLIEDLGGIEEFRLEPWKKLCWASAKKVVLEVSGRGC
ncbi:hypothetical protein SBDP1_250036 [Syntrophobacter sp. SbD1]|nr:hypothetical protein SBDP1_250036 [Syntrophobacter sp. SbD1]